MGEHPYLAERLAAQVLSYRADSLTRELRAKALDCVLDCITAALAGNTTPPVPAFCKVARGTFAKGNVPVWFAGETLGASGAAWCNAVAASSLDFDDGHRLARGHPGSAIIPAVLATASATDASHTDILAAIAIGYEVAIRLAAAQKHEKAQTHQSGRWTGYGVAAACGCIAGLNIDQLSHALAICGVWAPNQQANGSSGYARETGNWAKEGIPVSVLQALMAVDLARLGFTGPVDLFDHASHYEFSPSISGPFEPSLILGTYFKPYACCRYIHPALEAFRVLSAKSVLEPQNISRIDVATFAWALKLSNKVRPESLVDVQYSLPFCLAAFVIRGARDLAPISQGLLSDERIPQLAARIRLNVCPSFDRSFPRETLARVSVTLKSGDVLSSGIAAPPDQLTHRQLAEKFLGIAQGRIPDDHSRRILDALEPGRADLRTLQALLSEVTVPGVNAELSSLLGVSQDA